MCATWMNLTSTQLWIWLSLNGCLHRICILNTCPEWLNYSVESFWQAKARVYGHFTEACPYVIIWLSQSSWSLVRHGHPSASTKGPPAIQDQILKQDGFDHENTWWIAWFRTKPRNLLTPRLRKNWRHHCGRIIKIENRHSKPTDRNKSESRQMIIISL